MLSLVLFLFMFFITNIDLNLVDDFDFFIYSNITYNTYSKSITLKLPKNITLNDR